MKYTNFDKELHVIHTKEVEELKQALLAHGGTYEFADKQKIDANDLEDCPEVTADYYYELVKFKVLKAWIYENGEPFLQVTACTENGACHVDKIICDVPVRHVITGDVIYIISQMDEPEEKCIPLHQIIADIAINVGWERLDIIDSREMTNLIIAWANEFEHLHRSTDWTERGDYIDAIDSFSEEKIKELMK